MEEVIERSKNPNVKHVTKKGITYPGTRSRFLRSFTLIGTITTPWSPTPVFLCLQQTSFWSWPGIPKRTRDLKLNV